MMYTARVRLLVSFKCNNYNDIWKEPLEHFREKDAGYISGLHIQLKPNPVESCYNNDLGTMKITLLYSGTSL